MRNMNGNRDITDEMSQAYIAVRTEETPNLWNRVEKGFEDELAGMQTGKAAGTKRNIHWMRYAGIAAAVLICVIVIPLVTGNRDKSAPDTISYDRFEEPYVAGEGSQNNDMDAVPGESGYFMDEAAEESVEAQTVNAIKASVEDETAEVESMDIISIVGICMSIKK